MYRNCHKQIEYSAFHVVSVVACRHNFRFCLKCTYSSGDGWCRTIWMIRPGGYNGWCNVSAIELSFGCVLAFRAEYRCYIITHKIKDNNSLVSENDCDTRQSGICWTTEIYVYISRYASLTCSYTFTFASWLPISTTDVGCGPQQQQIIEQAIVFHLGSTLRLIAFIKSARNASIWCNPMRGTTSLPTTTDVINDLVYSTAGMLFFHLVLMTFIQTRNGREQTN